MKFEKLNSKKLMKIMKFKYKKSYKIFKKDINISIIFKLKSQIKQKY